MTSLRESDLRLPLLAFVFAYYVLTIIWAEIRRYHPQVVGVTNGLNKDDDRLVKGRLYRSLIMIFTTITCCFALYPSVYKVFIPIVFFDTTWMNMAGILLLFLSLIWIDFDK